MHDTLAAGPWRQVQAMVKKFVDCSDVRSVSTASRTERISLTVQWSAPKSKWTAKWTSFKCLFAKFRKSGAPAVNASFKLKLPRAILKLSLGVRSSVSRSKGSSTSTFQKTVKFFGIFKTREVCFRLSWCLRKLKGKTFLQAGCDPSGGVSRKDVGSTPPWKLLKLDPLQQQKLVVDNSLSELATWFCRRRLSRWQGQLRGLQELMGNLPPLSYFASEKERLAAAVQAGVVFLTLSLPYRLLSAGAVSRAALTATASVLVVGLMLNFFNGDKKLSTALWKLWGKLVNFIGQSNFFVAGDRFQHLNLFQSAGVRG